MYINFTFIESDNDGEKPADEELADVNETIPTLEHVSSSIDVLGTFLEMRSNVPTNVFKSLNVLYPYNMYIYMYCILFYLFINYNTITNYILIIYELSNLDYLLGIVSQTRDSGGNRTYDPHTISPITIPTRLPGHARI